jgi:2-polyprenyl-3-methyl-5-hydroxy-6-metoxy-1,4-benzoquinol methylase
MAAYQASKFSVTVCPIDQLPLAASDGDHGLACPKGHSYAVHLGIPRLLAPERNYAEAFAAQWHHYRITQLDSYTKTDLSKNRLRRCLGEDLWRDLQQPNRLEVLEAGCGAGRFSEILLQLPGTSLTSTDLSSAVESNQTNCPQSDRHRIIQCDIGQSPFLPGTYDIVVCLGVVQHTQNSEETIASLYAQVKPGGWLIFDHYEHSLSHYTRLGERALRPFLKRLSPEKGVAVTKALTRWFFPLHRAVRHVRLAQMALSRVSPLLTYFHALPELNDKLQYEWSELDTHDTLTDWHKHVRSPRSIRATLEALQAQNIWVTKGGNGVEARCQKPA